MLTLRVALKPGAIILEGRSNASVRKAWSETRTTKGVELRLSVTQTKIARMSLNVTKLTDYTSVEMCARARCVDLTQNA